MSARLLPFLCMLLLPGAAFAYRPFDSTDDVFYDARRKRVYVICGEGRVDVLRQETPDRYTQEASIKTAPRARTGLFVPEEQKLYVAAPAAGSSAARVLVYHVK